MYSKGTKWVIIIFYQKLLILMDIIKWFILRPIGSMAKLCIHSFLNLRAIINTITPLTIYFFKFWHRKLLIRLWLLEDIFVKMGPKIDFALSWMKNVSKLDYTVYITICLISFHVFPSKLISNSLYQVTPKISRKDK